MFRSQPIIHGNDDTRHFAGEFDIAPVYILQRARAKATSVEIENRGQGAPGTGRGCHTQRDLCPSLIHGNADIADADTSGVDHRSERCDLRCRRAHLGYIAEVKIGDQAGR